MNSFADIKTATLAEIIRLRSASVPANILVVGCGSGIEAAILAEELGSQVIGIDIGAEFDSFAAKIADLRRGDATKMEFQNESFDFVYSFHALEHIPEYKLALHEMKRVLKPGGGFLIGTPNRSRVIGYLGSKNTSLNKKIKWNIADWKAKLSGKFKNEFGAHAGFTLKELHTDLENVFSKVDSITNDYYYGIYGQNKVFVSTLIHLGIWRWLFPAIYFYGKF